MENIETYIQKHFSIHNGVIDRDDRKNSNGSLDKDGYLILKIKGRQFKAHRIAWLLYYGRFPETEIDHINGNKLDNSIENLRLSDRRTNVRNKVFPRNKKTGEIGIYIDNTKGLKKKYATKIEGATYRFYTLEEAKAYRKERKCDEGKRTSNDRDSIQT